MENEKTETTQTEFQITLAARARSINARMTGGGDTYTMILLPGTATGVWADQIPGCEIVSDDYPRARGIRASERHGETTIKVTLPAGTIKLEIFKPASTRERSSKSAYLLSGAGEWIACTATSRKTAGGTWETVIRTPDGQERVA